ncbi:unnamed protein product [Rhodiola kirilowii]
MELKVWRSPRKTRMADLISRTLRDGKLPGEHSPALTIKDCVTSPFGLEVFDEMLTQLAANIAAGKAQSEGVVIVALSRSPSWYTELLRRRDLEFEKLTCVLDCYSDPLGWKKRIGEMSGSVAEDVKGFDVVRDVRDLGNLLNLIVEAGRRLVGDVGRKFSVGIDCVSELLRYENVSAVSGFLSKLRSHETVSSVFWLLRSDLCDDRTVSAVEYLSSVVASVELVHQFGNGRKGKLDVGSMREMNLKRGKFNVRFKLRNGRVKVTTERFQMEKSGIKFTSIIPDDGGAVGSQDILPKLQFNLQLSEKEKDDRAQVVLPFEHQGKGEPIQIYDGRKSQQEENAGDSIPTIEKIGATGESVGKGEIIYFRDSDDEMPDSDEDPDDDLDI